MKQLLTFIFIIVYISIGIFLENKKIIKQPSYWSLYGVVSTLIYIEMYGMLFGD